MLTTKFIFITITLLILVLVSIKMRVPKTSFPLFIIYLIFIINNFPKEPANNKNLDSSFSSDTKEINNFNSKEILLNTKELKKPVKPEPLVFEIEKKKTQNIKQKSIVSNSQDKKTKTIEPNENIALVVKDIKICKSIYKRTPVGSDIIFTNNVDSLYCYTRIQNPGPKREVKHIWYYNNQMMTQVRYNVRKSNIYRSWTKKTILANQIGNWRVDIQDNKGTIIGSKDFKIQSISELN